MDIIITVLLLHFDDFTMRSPQPDAMKCGDRLLEHHLIALDAPDYLFGQCVTNVIEQPALRPMARPEGGEA